MTGFHRQLPTGSTTVRRLRARISGLDPTTTQRRAEAVLNECRFGEVDLPESAILCIRTFRDPLPGTLRLDRRGPGTNAGWQRAVTDAMGRFARGAVRPALEPVPANAEAVLFLSPEEMLASLARDWCEGTAVLRWWWKSLYRGADLAEVVWRSWREAPEYAPAALQQLAATAHAAPFIQVLGPAHTRDLLSAVLEKFSLTAWLAILEETSIVGDPQKPVERVGGQTMRRVHARVPPAQLWTPPWRSWIARPEEGGLAGDSLALLVTSLMLARTPVVLRSPKFVEEAHAWMRSSNVGQIHDNPQPTEQPEQEAPPAREAPGPVNPHADGHVPVFGQPANASPHSETPLPKALSALPETKFTSEQRREPFPKVFGHVPAQGIAVSEAGGAGPPAIPEASNVGKIIAPEISVSRAMPATAEAQSWEIIDVEFGGVFYLINLGLFLNLYGDFTSPLKPGLALPIWDFVALVGEHILGARLRTDPVWPLLARLSGRDQATEPGAGFLAPQDWPLPSDWALFLMEIPLRESRSSEPKFPSPPGADERGRNEPSHSIEFPAAPPTGSLSEWLAWLMPYLRWRLLRALGLETRQELACVLCAHPARIQFNQTYFGVRFQLARLPIQVRLSGLDRNPGWVPSAGRFVTFHYE
jgi:hypothetical protein